MTLAEKIAAAAVEYNVLRMGKSACASELASIIAAELEPVRRKLFDAYWAIDGGKRYEHIRAAIALVDGKQIGGGGTVESRQKSRQCGGKQIGSGGTMKSRQCIIEELGKLILSKMTYDQVLSSLTKEGFEPSEIDSDTLVSCVLAILRTIRDVIQGYNKGEYQ